MGVLSLVLLNNTIGASLRALCLDGSPGAFYFRPSTLTEHKDDWLLYFEGGGWCYSELDCLERASTHLGSSTSYTPSLHDTTQGILSANCTDNPAFCNYNFVFMKYCDGNSFSGDRTHPLSVKGHDIHFRGHAILKTVLQTLTSEYALSSARNVALTGSSAGGLATFLHTNYIGEYLARTSPHLQRYGALPVSGFFLHHANVHGELVYPTNMETVFKMSNASAGVDQACIKDLGDYRCNFAEFTLPNIVFPIFIINSAYDRFQAQCILTAEPFRDSFDNNKYCATVPGWEDCGNSVSGCNATQIYGVWEYEGAFTTTLLQISKMWAAGNGGFIYSCNGHCLANSHAFGSIAIDGVTISEAVNTWWDSLDGGAKAPSTNHTYLPCLYGKHAEPCNPTCPDGSRIDLDSF